MSKQPRLLRAHKNRNFLLVTLRKYSLRKRIGNYALVVVRQNQSVQLLHRVRKLAENLVFHLFAKRVPALLIQPHNLLVPRNDPCLHGSHSRNVPYNSLLFNSQFAHATAKRRSRFVIGILRRACHSKSFNAYTKRDKIGSHIACTAQKLLLLLKLDDRNGRLRRKP